MARKGENIYKRKDGRDEGRYIKGYKLDGTAKFGYIYGKTYADVKDRLIKLKAGNSNKSTVVSSNLKLSEWFDIWYDNLTHVKQSTKTIYRSYANKHLKPKMGNIRLKKINRDVLQRYVDELSIELSAKSVKAIFSMTKLCLKAAYDSRLIENIYDNIRLPKTVSKEVKVLTKQEQERLEQVIENFGNNNDIGVLICLYTGIRIGELCALRWENINLDRKMMTINRTIYRVIDSNGTHKTKIVFSHPKSATSERDIPIAEFLVERLRKMQKKEGFVINNNGKYVEPAVYRRRYKQLLELAEIDYITYHAIRHTFAVRALELGVDVKTLSELLGHSTVSTTLNYYGHSLPEHKRNQIELIGSLFSQSI